MLKNKDSKRVMWLKLSIKGCYRFVGIVSKYRDVFRINWVEI